MARALLSRSPLRGSKPQRKKGTKTGHLSTDENSVARHALGLPNLNMRSYRNRYATFGGEQLELWMGLVRKQYAEVIAKRPRSTLFYFALTQKGAVLALEPGETLCPEDFPE
jgi:hypothetical protein